MGSNIEEPQKGQENARGEYLQQGVDSKKEEKKAEETETPDAPSEMSEAMLDYQLDMYTNLSISEGDVVQGTILQVNPSEVLVNIGYKSDGMVDVREFDDGQGNVTVKPGDKVDFLVERLENADGYVVLSKDKAEKMKVWDRVEEAYRDNRIVKGRVIDRVKGGLSVDIGVRAFLPGSLVDIRPVRNLDGYKGQEFRMRIIKFNKKRGNIVLSRKQVMEEEEREKRDKTMESLEEGAVLPGVVKNLTEYGAFVDLGGISGLLHITDMSWGRISSPAELFKNGDEIEVVVLKHDKDSGRVALGYKQKTDDPWLGVREDFPEGARVRGKVVSLTDYGAFVELAPGVEGLVHVSEMSWTKRIKHPSKKVQVGDEVEAMVLGVDEEARRISLGLKQAERNPWDSIAERYSSGDKVKGSVRNLTDFGAFVEIEEGIDGLIHISDLSWTKRVRHPSEVLQKGEEVEAIILSIDAQNQRLSLGLKQLQDEIWRDFFARHSVGDIVTGKVVRLTDFGAFVEVEDGIEGLVHVSELAHERVEKPSDRVAEGEELTMKVIRLDPDEKRIGLSVRAATDGSADAVDIAAYTDPGRGRVSMGDVFPDLAREFKEARRKSREDKRDERRPKGSRRHQEFDDEDIGDYEVDYGEVDEEMPMMRREERRHGEDGALEYSTASEDEESEGLLAQAGATDLVSAVAGAREEGKDSDAEESAAEASDTDSSESQEAATEDDSSEGDTAEDDATEDSPEDDSSEDDSEASAEETSSDEGSSDDSSSSDESTDEADEKKD